MIIAVTLAIIIIVIVIITSDNGIDKSYCGNGDNDCDKHDNSDGDWYTNHDDRKDCKKLYSTISRVIGMPFMKKILI